MHRTLWLPPVTLTLLTAAAIEAWWWPLMTADMGRYLLPWMQHIMARGPIGAFAVPFSNYTPPYLYLLALASPLTTLASPVTVIKLVSLAGGLALALAMWRLFRALVIPQAARAAALVLLLPSVALNAGLMSQCDTLWSGACIMALAMAIERRHAAMLAWCGVAVAFKMQALFAAPFFLALVIHRRVPLRLWPIAPAAALGMMLPALLAGWPAGDLATIYFRQADDSHALALLAPNVWMLLQNFTGTQSGVATAAALAAAASASAGYVAWFARRLPASAPALLNAALLAPLLTVGLLPRMHERFFFLADVIVFALAMAARDRESLRIAVLVEGGSLLALLAYLTNRFELAPFGAVLMLLGTWAAARPLLFPPASVPTGKPSLA